MVLEAQDAALGRLVDHLEDEVEDFTVILTADHGSTPKPATTGAWAISTDEPVFEAAFPTSMIDAVLDCATAP